MFVKSNVAAAEPIITKIVQIEKDFEYACIKAKFGSVWYVFVCIYRSPAGDLTRFFDSLCSLLTELTNGGWRLVVCGDFNIDLNGNSAESCEFKDVARSFGLVICVDQPTRTTNHSSKTIDNILTDSRCDVQSCSVDESVLSDHRYLLLRIRVSESTPKVSVYRRKMNPRTIARFRECLKKETWPDLNDNCSTANDKFQYFYNVFQCHFNNCFPLMADKLGSRGTSWYTDDLRRQAIELRDIYHLSKQIDDAVLRRAFKEKHAQYNREVERVKRQYFDRQIYDSKNRTKTTWNIIKSVNNGKVVSKKQINIRDGSGEVIVDPQRVAAMFGEHFSVSASAGGDGSASYFNANVQCNVTHCFFLYPTDAVEVYGAVKHASIKHSAGYDDVPCSLLSSVADILTEPLTFLFNGCISEGVYPDCLKTSKVLPIHKKGDYLNMTNYRPIAVPSVFAKIFEKLLNDRLLQYFDRYGLISESQFGFVRGKSTADAVYAALTEVYERLDNGENVAGLFFDLSKAFDLIDHSLLFLKMESMGIRGKALNFFQSFLSDRNFRVSVTGNSDNIIKNYYSDFRCVTVGIPQGSILGPTFFIIYVNDIASQIKSGKLCQYADDTSLVVSGSTMASVASGCATAVQDMSDWCVGQQLKLNTDKTALMQFQNGASAGSLYVGHRGKSIPTSAVANFLGITVDCRLRWEDHCTKLSGKLSSALFGVRGLRCAVSVESLKLFYFAYVESRLRYGVIFWGCSPHAERVFKLQKKIIRCILDKPQTASCRPLFRSLCILPLASVYIYELLMYCKRNEGVYLRNCDISKSVNTRNSEDLSIPKHKTHLYESSPHYKAIQCYNKLPINIRRVQGLNQFKTALKEFLVQKSFYSLTEFLSM